MRLLIILLLILKMNPLKADEINYLLNIPNLEIYKLNNANKLKYLSAKKNFKIGINKILKRIDSLVIYAIEEWTSRGYKVASPTSEDKRSGILVVTLPKGVNGWEIYDHLRLNKSAFTSPVDSPNDLRIALHFFNTKDEIRRVFDFIERFSNQ